MKGTPEDPQNVTDTVKIMACNTSSALGDVTSQHVVCNHSDGNTSALTRDEDLAKYEIAVQAVIFAFAVIGNVVVMVVLFSRHKKLSRMNLMIVHLSVADLFVAFFNVLPQLIWDITNRFYGNDLLCRSVKYMQVVAMYASSFVLVTTAIDRYLAIVHPMTSQTWTQRKTHLLVGVAWGLSLGFSIPQLTIFALREIGPNVYQCWAVFKPDWTLPFYITWITIAIYIVPSLLLVFAYGRICHVVWRSMRAKEPSIRDKKTSSSAPKSVSWRSRARGHMSLSASSRGLMTSQSSENGTLMNTSADVQRNTTSGGGNSSTGSNPRAHVRGLSKAKVKTVRLTMTVIVCYLVCWGPWFVAQMWSVWDEHAPFTSHAMAIILLLASLNSCTNPWIYLAFSDSLCRQVTRCWRGANHRLERASTATFDSESRFRSTRGMVTDVSNVDFSTTTTTSPHSAIPLTEPHKAGSLKA